MKEKYKRLLSNTFILGLGTFGSKLLVFFLMPFYTRCLLPEEYSTADLITQIANLLIPLACIGLTDGIFRFTMDRELDKSKVFSTGVNTIFISLACFALLSPLLMLVDMLGAYMWLIAIYVVAANLHSACAQYLRALGKTKIFAFQGVLGTVLTIAFNLLFLLAFDMGIVGYVLSIVVADILTTAFLVIYARLYRIYRIGAYDGKVASQMLKYSIPLIPTTVFWWITSVSDRYLVAYICGDAENGLYSAAYKIPTVLTLLATIFIEAWQISAVNDSSDDKKKEREEFFSKVFESYVGLIFIACTFLIALSKVCTVILFAPGYYESWKFIPPLLVATAFSSFVTFFGSVYMLKKKSVLSFVTALVGALLNIVLNILLIPDFGALGAAVATVASYAAVFIIRGVNTQKYVHFNLHIFRFILNTLLVSAQCVVMIAEFDFWMPLEAAFVSAVLLLNLRPIVSGAKQIWSSIVGKIKK